ncbi:MAG TPA: hypothetical protein VKA91_06190 [Nitrososphaeraceae archaeon]|nr:hypothetical protein [Nitrososphaeraceae archaeon]
MPVTFDSYPKEDGSRKTHYGRFITQDNKKIGVEHIIRYDKGITSDHVIASGSYPVNFDYASLEVESYDTGGSSSIIKNNAPYIRKDSSNKNPGKIIFDDPLAKQDRKGRWHCSHCQETERRKTLSKIYGPNHVNTRYFLEHEYRKIRKWNKTARKFGVGPYRKNKYSGRTLFS